MRTWTVKVSVRPSDHAAMAYKDCNCKHTREALKNAHWNVLAVP